MILQICRSCRVISNKWKNGTKVFFNKGLCYTTSKKMLVMNYGFFSQKRTFYSFWRKPSIEELRVKDKVPDQYKLIYKNSMDNYLLSTQIITTLSAAIVGLCLIVSDGIPYQLDNKAAAPDNSSIIFITAFALVVVLLQVLLSKIPVRIYSFPQKKKYLFVFYGNMPLTQKTFTCKVGDLIESSGGITPWKNSRYLLKSGNQRMTIFLLDDFFRRPADLFIMMGLQPDPDTEDTNDKK